MFSIHNIKRNINKNTKNIIIIIIGVIFIIGLIQLFNYMAKKRKNDNYSSSNYEVNKGQAYSILSDTKVSESTNTKNVDLIDKFINYCNNGEVENAYNLLTDECKQIYYNTIDEFTKNYYNKVFGEAKTYSAQSWITSNIGYTYKVKILKDMMSTGKYDSSNSIEDYYTIVNNEKLNINKYIGRKELNVKSENNNIEVAVVYKDIYLDYEQYCMDFKNKNNYNIAIDSKETTSGIYLTGDNDVKYSSFIHELTIDQLVVEANKNKEINIKFNKSYNPDRLIKNITIANIVLEYEKELEKNTNKTIIIIKL